MKVEGIFRVAILVKDLEATAKLYSDLFGLKFEGPGTVPVMNIRNMRSTPEGVLLVSPLTSDGPAARALEQRGEGLSMLGLWVSDLKQACAEMKAKGIRQVAEVGTREVVFHPKDLHGVMIALFQH